MAHTLNSARTAIESLWARMTEKLPLIDGKEVSIGLCFWVAVSFFAAQRFLLPNFAIYACILPLLATFYYLNKDTVKRNTFIFLALFWSIDQSFPSLPLLTPTVLRYIIYGTAFAILLGDSIKHSKLASRSFLMVWAGVAIFYGALTLWNFEEVQYSQLFRDTQIFILLTVLLCFPYNDRFRLDFSFLFILMIAFLLSELSNFFIFSEHWHGKYLGYMNYDSTKFLIIFPSLYALLVKRFIPALVLIALTIPVLLGYQTRYVFLSYIGVLILAFYLLALRHKMLKRFFVSLTLLTIILLVLGITFHNADTSYRPIIMLQLILEDGFDAIQFLDQVRYAETKAFFQIPLHEIVFGRGFGSGILDSDRSIAQVYLSIGQTIEPGYFYGLHDLWTKIGIRFGLIPLCIFILWVLFQYPKHSREGAVVWLLTLVVLYNAVYTASGLIMLSFLICALKYYHTHAPTRE